MRLALLLTATGLASSAAFASVTSAQARTTAAAHPCIFTTNDVFPVIFPK